MAEDDVPGVPSRVSVSALAVPFTVPPVVERLRQRWDPAALAGARPHVTVLYPFLACEALVPEVRTALAALVGRVPAFEVRFERTRRFAGLLWIEPEPAAPFAALTAAIVERWPDFPPYGGRFEDVIPHLTIVESEVAPLDAIEDAVTRAGPFIQRAQRLELWCQDPAGRWRPRWRLPFGVRP